MGRTHNTLRKTYESRALTTQDMARRARSSMKTILLEEQSLALSKIHPAEHPVEDDIILDNDDEPELTANVTPVDQVAVCDMRQLLEYFKEDFEKLVLLMKKDCTPMSYEMQELIGLLELGLGIAVHYITDQNNV